jgi:hypothetical protein
MSFSNYTNLRAAVKGALHRSDLDTAIQDFVTLAEDRLNKRLRLRGMENRVTASISAEYIALPDDFLAMRNFQLNSTPRIRLEYATPEYLDSLYPDGDSTGRPKFYTFVGGEIQLAPIPDGTYTAEMDYYQKLDLATDTTNWVLENAPRCYYTGSLMEAYLYLKDEKRASYWEQRFEQAIQDVERADKGDRFPDFGLQMRADTGAPV